MKREQKWASTTLVLACWFVLTAPPAAPSYAIAPSIPPPPVQDAQPTPAQLEQLVAPIALYPDSLVAQILAAATYPEQVVEAERWMQAHGDLEGEALAQQVDGQPWAPSVKALTEFPSVVANMDKNLSWTSSLGDAYVNHQQDVMDAIQVMRQRAMEAGNLNGTPEQKVRQEDQTIVIEPTDPQVVYVPQYDPWLVYGATVVAWPGWYWDPELFFPGPGIVFGPGVDIVFFKPFRWGCHHWGSDWHHHRIVFDHHPFVSHSRTFINRNTFERDRAHFEHGGEFRGGRGSAAAERAGAPAFRSGPQHAAPPNQAGGGSGASSGFHRNRELVPGRGSAAAERAGAPAFRSGPQHAFAPPHGEASSRWGAFSGFDRGGVTRSYSSRGSSSFGGAFGGGGFHGGGGGGRR